MTAAGAAAETARAAVTGMPAAKISLSGGADSDVSVQASAPSGIAIGICHWHWQRRQRDAAAGGGGSNIEGGTSRKRRCDADDDGDSGGRRKRQRIGAAPADTVDGLTEAVACGRGAEAEKVKISNGGEAGRGGRAVERSI